MLVMRSSIGLSGRAARPVCRPRVSVSCSGRASFSVPPETPALDAAFTRSRSRPVYLPAQRRIPSSKNTSCAASAAGGGGSDGIAGGGGGDGGGEGFSGGSPGAGGWDARRIWTLIYALGLIGGGMFAFVKKGSRPSLIASSAVATCLLAAVWQMGVYQQAGMGIAMVTSAALTVAMGNRYRKSRKFMPSGLVALVSLFSMAWYANWPN